MKYLRHARDLSNVKFWLELYYSRGNEATGGYPHVATVPTDSRCS